MKRHFLSAFEGDDFGSWLSSFKERVLRVKRENEQLDLDFKRRKIRDTAKERIQSGFDIICREQPMNLWSRLEQNEEPTTPSRVPCEALDKSRERSLRLEDLADREVPDDELRDELGPIFGEKTRGVNKPPKDYKSQSNEMLNSQDFAKELGYTYSSTNQTDEIQENDLQYISKSLSLQPSWSQAQKSSSSPIIVLDSEDEMEAFDNFPGDFVELEERGNEFTNNKMEDTEIDISQGRILMSTSPKSVDRGNKTNSTLWPSDICKVWLDTEKDGHKHKSTLEEITEHKIVESPSNGLASFVSGIKGLENDICGFIPNESLDGNGVCTSFPQFSNDLATSDDVQDVNICTNTSLQSRNPAHNVTCQQQSHPSTSTTEYILTDDKHTSIFTEKSPGKVLDQTCAVWDEKSAYTPSPNAVEDVTIANVIGNSPREPDSEWDTKGSLSTPVKPSSPRRSRICTRSMRVHSPLQELLTDPFEEDHNSPNVSSPLSSGAESEFLSNTDVMDNPFRDSSQRKKSVRFASPIVVSDGWDTESVESVFGDEQTMEFSEEITFAPPVSSKTLNKCTHIASPILKRRQEIEQIEIITSDGKRKIAPLYVGPIEKVDRDKLQKGAPTIISPRVSRKEKTVHSLSSLEYDTPLRKRTLSNPLLSFTPQGFRNRFLQRAIQSRVPPVKMGISTKKLENKPITSNSNVLQVNGSSHCRPVADKAVSVVPSTGTPTKVKTTTRPDEESVSSFTHCIRTSPRRRAKIDYAKLNVGIPLLGKTSKDANFNQLSLIKQSFTESKNNSTQSTSPSIKPVERSPTSKSRMVPMVEISHSEGRKSTITQNQVDSPSVTQNQKYSVKAGMSDQPSDEEGLSRAFEKSESTGRPLNKRPSHSDLCQSPEKSPISLPVHPKIRNQQESREELTPSKSFSETPSRGDSHWGSVFEDSPNTKSSRRKLVHADDNNKSPRSPRGRRSNIRHDKASKKETLKPKVPPKSPQPPNEQPVTPQSIERSRLEINGTGLLAPEILSSHQLRNGKDRELTQVSSTVTYHHRLFPDDDYKRSKQK